MEVGMADLKDEINELIAELKQVRDELKVQLHLAKEDIKDDWDQVEGNLEKLEAKARNIGDAAKDASGDVGEAAKLLAEEVKSGFDKIRSRF
jgi:predicted  nucleic acid-binding Zn-ribbon protein